LSGAFSSCAAIGPSLDRHSICLISHLPTTATRRRFLEKQPKLDPESLSNMPERNHSRIALSQFEAADVGRTTYRKRHRADATAINAVMSPSSAAIVRPSEQPTIIARADSVYMHCRSRGDRP
jgi:hypothetical protein